MHFAPKLSEINVIVNRSPDSLTIAAMAMSAVIKLLQQFEENYI